MFEQSGHAQDRRILNDMIVTYPFPLLGEILSAIGMCGAIFAEKIPVLVRFIKTQLC
jgi:hypothetical protein